MQICELYITMWMIVEDILQYKKNPMFSSLHHQHKFKFDILVHYVLLFFFAFWLEDSVVGSEI